MSEGTHIVGSDAPDGTPEDAPPPTQDTKEPARGRLAFLSLVALGVVFGDIGTSPLYAFREALAEDNGVAVSTSSVLGVASLIFWALVIVVSIKYLVYVLRADNRGEGGILALTALITPRQVRRGSLKWLLLLAGLFGTALLYGDGMITPAISVLSAVEGLEFAAPALHPYVIPITVGILILLFLFQSRGTAVVGSVFGPVVLLWFLTLATLGINQIVRTPEVLAALAPWYAANFLLQHGMAGLLVLGSVFLVVTGGEALYADLGHVGKRPIRVAWFALVLPALVLNYFGQSALLLRNPAALENPFYRMVPIWGLIPVLVLATAATVIASQALISGAFSLTFQSAQLGYSPPVAIGHTSEEEYGQVFVPSVNWMLMIATVALVLAFRSSSNLAAAYGVAVTLTMLITTVLLFVVMIERWKWPWIVAVPLTAGFLAVDLTFVGANLFKIPNGGWVPLVVALAVFILMTTWTRGRALIARELKEGRLPLEEFLASVRSSEPPRVEGTGVFLFRDATATPPALLTNLRANHVLHETVLIVAVEVAQEPKVPPARRDEVVAYGDGFFGVTLHVGFMEEVDVPHMLHAIVRDDLRVEAGETTYFLGRETVFAPESPLPRAWRSHLFALLYRNSRHVADLFHLPRGRVVELGVRIEA